MFQDPTLNISQHIWDFAGSLYMDELNYVRHGCKSDIRYEAIKKVIFLQSKWDVIFQECVGDSKCPATPIILMNF